jgi:hypothetical protein
VAYAIDEGTREGRRDRRGPKTSGRLFHRLERLERQLRTDHVDAGHAGGHLCCC